MFKKITRTDKQTKLEREIESVLDHMSQYNSYSEEYKIMSANLEQLYKAKSYERSRKVSPDTIAVIAGNLLGIAFILWHEKTDIITTKALGFVMKGRV